jgi:predicted TPR repeat methyltransferase
MDFSPAMLGIFRSKIFTRSLKQHDLLVTPWPYPNSSFAVVVCCGVFHFIAGLGTIFGEAQRVLHSGGIFAFTTRVAPFQEASPGEVFQENSGDFEIYSHAPGYIEALLKKEAFTPPKYRIAMSEKIFLPVGLSKSPQKRSKNNYQFKIITRRGEEC